MERIIALQPVYPQVLLPHFGSLEQPLREHLLKYALPILHFEIIKDQGPGTENKLVAYHVLVSEGVSDLGQEPALTQTLQGLRHGVPARKVRQLGQKSDYRESVGLHTLRLQELSGVDNRYGGIPTSPKHLSQMGHGLLGELEESQRESHEDFPGPEDADGKQAMGNWLLLLHYQQQTVDLNLMSLAFPLLSNSSLPEYHDTCLEFLRTLHYSDMTSDLFRDLIGEMMVAEKQTKPVYFYVLEQMLLHNSDRLKSNKLASMLNLALAVSLDSEMQDVDSFKAGLLMIRFHLRTMQRSQVFLPQVWKFILKMYSAILSQPPQKRYEQMDWQPILSTQGLSLPDLTYVLIMTTLQLVVFNKPKPVVQTLRPMIQQFETRTKEQLLGIVLSNLEVANEIGNHIVDFEVPFMIRQLTPRILSLEKSNKDQLRELKKKRSQLKRTVIGDLRSRVHSKLQEQSIKQEAKRERVLKRQKKEMFIMQKQTADAKKLHRMNKITKGKRKSKSK